ncbi:MAG TPA: hypothetical protein VGM90_18565 [Kofleriaceae bacterium]|jgi:hypothetical protein
MNKRGFVISALMAVSFLGCATNTADVEDPENDVFLTDDAKADAFGVEDWSPDGAAVLTLVSSASQAKLQSDVGLTAKVAKSIVTARTALTGHKFTDLSQLDAAPYVGKTVFARLLEYANDNHLFKTSLRVPLLLDDNNGGDAHPSITTLNARMRAKNLAVFGRYTFADDSTDYDAKVQSYNARITKLGTAEGAEITDSLLEYSYAYNDYTGICYIGDAKQVIDVIQAQAGVMVGEMYNVYGWRHGTDKWKDDNIENESDLGDDFKNYKTTSDDVMLVYANGDDGDITGADVIPRCR